jgi:hypothetical protein
MEIFNLIRLRNSGTFCRRCVHFQNDPSLIEATYPGLTAFSSGYASVRDGDGFCNHHQLYLSERDSCQGFVPCISEFHHGEKKAVTIS